MRGIRAAVAGSQAMILSRPISLIIALAVIAAVFCVSAALSYQTFRAELVDRQLIDQKKLSQIVRQSLTQYFRRVQYVTESAAGNQAFNPKVTQLEDALRFRPISLENAERAKRDFSIQTILPNQGASVPAGNAQELLTWQVYKGLPEKDEQGKLVASERRRIARQAMETFRELKFVFEVDVNGNIVFIEPFTSQKDVGNFNFSFRDYLTGPKATKSTTLSEAFVSLDKESTQTITVSTPVFDESGKVAKVICASVSNATLRSTVFQPLKQGMELRDDTVFYFIDHHGHVVASSSSKGDYEPQPQAATDDKDNGNFRGYGPLAKIKWEEGIFDRGSDWQRRTKTWTVSSLLPSYSDEYNNNAGTQVLGTFYPVTLLDKRAPHYGILVETPIAAINQSQTQLSIIFVCTIAALLLIFFSCGRIIWKSYIQTTKDLAEKEAQLQEMFAQVAHDVRSPLVALQLLLPHIKNEPETVRVIFRDTVNQIDDIANDLMSPERQPHKRA